MCIALAALDAVIQVQGSTGTRQIAMADFHRLPGNTPHIETNLQPGELITAIDLPTSRFAARSHYLKLRDRTSYAFALVSVAAALELNGNTIRNARIALGGVAHKPWRSLEAEQILINAPANRQTFQAAADASVRDAKSYQHNGFKIDMAKRVIVAALTTASGGTAG